MTAAPFVLSTYWVDVLDSVGIYALLALSLNLILGEAGLYDMGHAAFFAVGAYTTAILTTRLGVPLLLTLPAAALAAGLFAALVALPVLRLRGDYLLIVTVGVGEIVRIALVNDVGSLTGGANGIFGIPRPFLFGLKLRTPEQLFPLIWGAVALTILVFHRLSASRFGRQLRAVREDEVAAEGSGVNTARARLTVFVLGSAWAGMAGTLFAAKMTVVSPESFGFWESVLVFTMVLLGGAGSIPGVLLGAFLVAGLPELFRGLASARMLVFGLALMVMMVVRPGGLWPRRARGAS
ncbi:MAG: branched-chain amino acid ABC transporter permease [Holophagales bacterium]|nr:branched-chain amino acid ABC transporter permease [Holophagales bacterium]